MKSPKFIFCSLKGGKNWRMVVRRAQAFVVACQGIRLTFTAFLCPTYPKIVFGRAMCENFGAIEPHNKPRDRRWGNWPPASKGQESEAHDGLS